MLIQRFILWLCAAAGAVAHLPGKLTSSLASLGGAFSAKRSRACQGCEASPKAARAFARVLDELGPLARLSAPRGAATSDASGRPSRSTSPRGAPAGRRAALRRTLVCGGSSRPDHDAVMRIGGKAPGRRAHSTRRHGNHVPTQVTAASEVDRPPASQRLAVCRIRCWRCFVLLTLRRPGERRPEGFRLSSPGAIAR